MMAMSIQDQRKILAAGFKIFRLVERDKKIKIIKAPGSWRTYGKYQTQKECKHNWDFLMMNDMYVSG